MTAPPPSLSLRNRVLQRALMQLRPAALTAVVKKALRISRTPISTQAGKFYVDPVSEFASAISAGYYEPGLTFALWCLLPNGGTFVDIGANEGYFSVIAAKLVGPSGRVIAAEPQARLRHVLDKNFELNSIANVELFDTAISDQRGSATLHLSPDTNTGSTGLQSMTRYETAKTAVQTITLSDLFAQAKLDRVDLLKMDIEGFEYEAILGSPELFRERRIRAFALELHPKALVARDRAPEEIASFLKGCGYQIDLRFEHSLHNSIWLAQPSETLHVRMQSALSS